MSQDWAAPFPIDRFILPGMKAEPSSRRTAPVADTSTGAARTRSTRATPAVAEAALPTDEDAALRVLLAGICEQDPSSLARFYDLTVGRVYGVALRIVRRADMAEEVVSDVYMQVWRDARRYDDARGRILGWLLVIARSRALDLLRRQDEAFSHPEPWELVAEPEAGRQDPHDLLHAARVGSAVHAAMLKLNPLQRQLLSLAFFRGLSHAEIVEHCGIPLGSVKTHIRRAMGILRNELGTDADRQG